MDDRPIVAEYDCETGEMTHRPMDDAEFADYEQRQKDGAAERAAAEEAPHPFVQAVDEMSETDRAALREALNA